MGLPSWIIESHGVSHGVGFRSVSIVRCAARLRQDRGTPGQPRRTGARLVTQASLPPGHGFLPDRVGVRRGRPVLGEESVHGEFSPPARSVFLLRPGSVRFTRDVIRKETPLRVARDGRQLHGSQTARPSLEASLLPCPDYKIVLVVSEASPSRSPSAGELVTRALMGTEQRRDGG